MKSQLLGPLRHRFARKPARSCDWHVAFVLDVKNKYQKLRKWIGIGFWLKMICILKRIPLIEVLIQLGNPTNKQKIALERRASFTNRPPSSPVFHACISISALPVLYLFRLFTTYLMCTLIKIEIRRETSSKAEF